MPRVYQAFNRRNKAWVKYKIKKGRFVPLNVKEREPKKPFKGVPIKGQRRK